MRPNFPERRGPRLAACVLALGIAGFAGLPAGAATPRFDVSYVWASDLARVQEYRRRVVGVLGRAMEPRLKVVHGERLWGLIYDRNGDAASTRRVADSHTRLLRSRGLDEAVPIISRPWSTLEAGRSGTAGDRPAAAPEASAVASAAPPAVPPRRVESSLERDIEDYVDAQRRRGRIGSDERTSWAVYDLDAGRELASINVDEPLLAASLIKPALALAFLDRAEAGRLVYGPKSRRQFERMIQKSDNSATNWVMRYLGGPRAAERLLRQRFGDVFRDIELVEYIPAGGRTYRNRASVADYVRFLRALWADELPGSAELKRLMALPNRDRLTGAGLPEQARVYDKTGSTRRTCGNFGIVEVEGPDGRSHAYAIAAVIEKRRMASSYGPWISTRGDVIREVSGLVYREMSQGWRGGAVAAFH